MSVRAISSIRYLDDRDARHVKFRCEHCGAKYSISDETVRGRILKIRCRSCQAIMVVRDPARSMGSMDSISAHDLRAFLSRNSPNEEESAAPKKWYLAREGQRFGPMGELEVAKSLREGRFRPTDHAWHAGMGDWRPVRDVPELAALVEDAGPQGAPPGVAEPSAAIDPDATAYEGPPQQRPKRTAQPDATGQSANRVHGIQPTEQAASTPSQPASPFSEASASKPDPEPEPID